jgi:uncharacterized membrane protein
MHLTLADAPIPLIAPDNTWALWAVIIIGVASSIWLEQTYRWAAKVSGPLLALVIAIVLSNLRIMPSDPDTPVYDAVWSYLVPLAVPLLLMKANVFRIVRESGRTFFAFHLCTVGTLLGAVLAGLIFHGSFERVPEAAGIMTGSYIGGGVNFAAVSAEFKMEGKITGALLVADNFVMAGAFAAIFGMAGSKLFRRWFPHPHSLETDAAGAKALADEHWKRKEIGLLDVAKALAVALAIAATASMMSKAIQGKPLQSAPAGQAAGGAVGAQGPARVENPAAPATEPARPTFIQTMAGNLYVQLTFLSIVVATLFHRQVSNIHGTQELGTYLLYIFLFVIGLPADLVTVLGKVPVMFGFCGVIAVTNMVVGLVLGKLFRQNLEDILIGINATLGGPPTAMAMAMAMGWSRLVLPALLVGIWGYIIGTGLGIAIAEALLKW